ncbi:hypothetical protein [Nocardia amamiensis]|uniref:hypothetical protein n=1 Tax=Nocardia amamiensis TaxID=404578 RepID=UPI0008321E81|nr:hypothetical protein [Nocardia amamiensis]
MSDIDPLTSNIEQLETSLTRSATASTAGDVAAVEVDPDGSLRAIRLTDVGRRLDPDTIVEAIVRLHAAALVEARKSVAEAIAKIENDPRLRTQHDRAVDALNQPVPRQAHPTTPSWPQPQTPTRPAPQQSVSQQRREPTPEEDEEMDRYYQRKSWLE